MATRYVDRGTAQRAAATKKRKKAARERAAAAREKQRKDGIPVNYWQRHERPLIFGREHFTIDAPFAGKRGLPLDDVVTEITWEDTSVILKGSITLVRPVDEKRMPLVEGDLIRCRVQTTEGGKWRDLWRMRVARPEINLADGTYQYVLTSDLSRLQLAQDSFRYVKGKKKHRKGWTAREIAADIARRYKIKLGKLPRTKYRIKKLNKKKTSPVDALLKAFNYDNKETGKNYVVDYWGARLNVTGLKRSKTMLELGPTLMEATLRAGTLSPHFGTVLTVRSTVDKGKKKKKKVSYKITSKAGVKRFGLVHKSITLKGIDSKGEAARKAKRLIARTAKPERTLTLTHQGIPMLRRGQAIRVRLMGHDLHPEHDEVRQICFVAGATHTVTPGDYTMEITLGFTDAVDDARAKRIAEKKKEAARKRKRAQEKKDQQRSDPAGSRSSGSGSGGTSGAPSSAPRRQAVQQPRARQRRDGVETQRKANGGQRYSKRRLKARPYVRGQS